MAKKITEVTSERDFVSKLRTAYRMLRRKGLQINFLGLMEYTGCATKTFEEMSEKYFSLAPRAYDWVNGNSLLKEKIALWNAEIDRQKK